MVDIAVKEGGMSVAANGGEVCWGGWLGLSKEGGSGAVAVSLSCLWTLFCSSSHILSIAIIIFFITIEDYGIYGSGFGWRYQRVERG